MVSKTYPLIPEQPNAPELVTEIPGPKARQLRERDSAVTSPSYTRDYALVVDHAIGSVITDPDGNRFLDGTAGIAVCATGHCHPHVLAAVESQMRRCLHMSGTDFYYETQIELAEKLNQLAPMKGRNRVFFTNSGAEAVEAALKLSRYHTGRQHVIAFLGAFHGRTYGAMSLTASKIVQRRGFLPLVPGVHHVSYPNPFHHRDSPQQSVNNTLRSINKLFKHKVAPEEVAAIFVEPIQGEGGYIVPPDSFLPRLRELCDTHGILLVCDEVQSGMGRTGKMWAVEHVGVEPDIITSAKGIASGLPLGAMIAREGVMDWPYGSHASTFGGNPVSCAASLATIELLQDSLLTHCEQMGVALRAMLIELQQECPLIGDVRGKGLMTAIELVTDPESQRSAADLRKSALMACFERGVLLLGCGESAIRFCPALTITEDQLRKIVAVLRDVLLALDANNPL